MNARPRATKGLTAGIVLAFVCAVLGSPFLHVEKGPYGRDDCPACQFQTSAVSAGPGAVFIVPHLLCRGILVPAASLPVAEGVAFAPGSRSPPQA